MICIMRLCCLLCLQFAALASCSATYESIHVLPAADKAVLTTIINTYRQAWLNNDSSTVLSLFADTAVIIPSGMQPIKGKAAMVKFWWPSDGHQTIISSYEITILNITGDAKWATIIEKGSLAWRYKNGATAFSQTQGSYEVTTFIKAGSKWKIISRIWTDNNVQKTNN